MIKSKIATGKFLEITAHYISIFFFTFYIGIINSGRTKSKRGKEGHHNMEYLRLLFNNKYAILLFIYSWTIFVINFPFYVCRLVLCRKLPKSCKRDSISTALIMIGIMNLAFAGSVIIIDSL